MHGQLLAVGSRRLRGLGAQPDAVHVDGGPVGVESVVVVGLAQLRGDLVEGGAAPLEEGVGVGGAGHGSSVSGPPSPGVAVLPAFAALTARSRSRLPASLCLASPSESSPRSLAFSRMTSAQV